MYGEVAVGLDVVQRRCRDFSQASPASLVPLIRPHPITIAEGLHLAYFVTLIVELLPEPNRLVRVVVMPLGSEVRNHGRSVRTWTGRGTYRPDPPA